MKVLVFVGTVGSGKTTHIRLLSRKLGKIKNRVSHLGVGCLFTRLFEEFLANLLLKDRKLCPRRALREYNPYLFRKLFRFWLTLDVFSIYVKFLLRVYLPAKVGYLIIVEEYIPSIISNYIYLSKALGLPLKNISFAINHMLRLLHITSPIKTIFLDADNEVLQKRWVQRRSLYERLDYIEMQRSLLLSISKMLSHSFLYIDTTDKSVEETHNQVLHYTLDWLTKVAR